MHNLNIVLKIQKQTLITKSKKAGSGSEQSKFESQIEVKLNAHALGWKSHKWVRGVQEQ